MQRQKDGDGFMRMKQIVAVSLLLAFLITGCGSGQQEAKHAEEANDLQHIEMSITNQSVSCTAEIVAQEEGFYKEEGLDVNFNIITTGPEAIMALTTKKVDVVCGGGTLTGLVSDEEGEDLVAIAGNMTDGTALYCREELYDELKDLTEESLKGKKYGTIRAGSGDLAFRTYLLEKGINPDILEFVEFPDAASIVQAVQKGAIDIGNVYMVFRETADATAGVKKLADIDELSESTNKYICCRIWARKADVDKNRDLYVKVIRAQLKGYSFFKHNNDEALKDAKTVIDVDEKVIRSQLFTYGHLTISPNIGKKKIETAYDTATKFKMVKGTIQVDDFIYNDVYEEALNSLIEEHPEDEVYQELLKEYQDTL